MFRQQSTHSGGWGGNSASSWANPIAKSLDCQPIYNHLRYKVYTGAHFKQIIVTLQATLYAICCNT